jgi:TusA-related sulfurtransferase
MKRGRAVSICLFKARDWRLEVGGIRMFEVREFRGHYLQPQAYNPSPIADSQGLPMIQADVKLDTLGYFCPMPIIMTSKKIKELLAGQVLEVLSDDEGIKKDMPAWCQTTGHQMVGLEEEANGAKKVYKAFVRKAKV